jgi:2-dehydro-3-deoxyphosphogluconate aldolase/(4S)-4-hydroxy-2-oxoglutarate aldolase
MKRAEKLDLIRKTGIIAIMRAESPRRLIAAADAIRAGGVQVIEVTMTTPGALDVIAEAAQKLGTEVLFGVGSVLDAETARAAILAGAGFVVAPTLNLQVVTLCNRYGVPVIPGCYTPTEMLTAWEAGADMVKLFPASAGGPDLVKAIRAPLPQLEIVAVGGVNLSNAAMFIEKGAVALGVGSSLVDHELLVGSAAAAPTAEWFASEISRVYELHIRRQMMSPGEDAHADIKTRVLKRLVNRTDLNDVVSRPSSVETAFEVLFDQAVAEENLTLDQTTRRRVLESLTPEFAAKGASPASAMEELTRRATAFIEEVRKGR